MFGWLKRWRTARKRREHKEMFVRMVASGRLSTEDTRVLQELLLWPEDRVLLDTPYDQIVREGK